VRVDGNDLLAVHRVVSEGVARARGGGGPTFIEAFTYRIGAHSTSDDPNLYRSQAEVDAWAAKDPLARLRAHLVHRGLLDDAAHPGGRPGAPSDYDAALEQELNAEIAEAIASVEELPPPARETLFDDVYADPPWHLAEQRAELLRCPPAPSHGGGRH